MKIFFENQSLFYLSLFLSVLFIGIIKFTCKKELSFTLQILSCSFLLCALSFPFMFKKETLKKSAFLIDISNSMPDENIYKRIAPLYEAEDKIFLFSEKLSPFTIDINELKNIAMLKDSWKSLNLGKTSLKDNIEKIISQNIFKKIILYTDGFETNENLLHFLSTSSSSFKIKVYPLIPDFSKQKINTENYLDLKTHFSPIETTNKRAKIHLLAKSNKNKLTSNIIVLQNDKEIFQKKIKIDNLKYTIQEINSESLKNGINNFIIKIFDNSGNILEIKNINITAIKKESILLLSNSLQDAHFLENILKNTGFNFISDYNIENNFDNLQKYKVIILNNFPYGKLGNQNAEKLVKWINDGGKFLMIGGEHSFGLGGYKNTKIEEILPVTVQESQKKIIRLNLAIALILDCSGSMENDSKIEFLRLSAKKLINNLNNDDYVGIVGFNTNSFTVFPISRTGEARQVALESLNVLSPYGGTNLLPAMNDAIDMLSEVRAGRKHVIILTDGKVPGNPQTFLDTTTIIRMTGGTVSTILLGETTGSELLKEMAKIGKGNFYQTNNISTLPNIFMKDLDLMKEDPALKENIYDVKIHNLKNTSLTNFPTLKGFVVTYPKDGATTELFLSSFAENAPLLISKKIGLGESVAFTSDMNGRWSSNWISWHDIHLFWEQILSNLLANKNSTSKNILDYDFSHYVKNGLLYLDLSLFSNVSSKDLALEIIAPNKNPKFLELKEVDLGHFVAKYDTPKKGAYKVILNYKGKKESPIIFDLENKNLSEEKHLSSNISLLNLLVSKSSGKINPSKKDLVSTGKIKTKQDISMYFIILSLISFLSSIFIRERF